MKFFPGLIAAALLTVSCGTQSASTSGKTAGPNPEDRSITVLHQSSKSLKERRAQAYISSSPGGMSPASGCELTWTMSAECAKKTATVIMSDISLQLIGEQKAFPPSEFPTLIKVYETRFKELTERKNQLEKIFSPGRREEPTLEEYEEYKKIDKQIEVCQLNLQACYTADGIIEDQLNRCAAYIISE